MLTISENVPDDIGYEQPSDDEMIKLAAIVRREAPWIDPFTDESFARAHFATGMMFRLPDTGVTACLISRPTPLMSKQLLS